MTTALERIQQFPKEPTYTAADMRDAWEAGRDAAADRVDAKAVIYRQSRQRASRSGQWSVVRQCDGFAEELEYEATAIRALTPPSAALAEGNKP